MRAATVFFLDSSLRRRIVTCAACFSVYSTNAGAIGPEISGSQIGDTQEIAGPKIPRAYARVGEFLELIKQKDGRRRNELPYGDVSKLLSYISANGVSFTDVNRPGSDVPFAERLTRHLSKQAIRESFVTGKGEAFLTLMHLGQVFAEVYWGYSAVEFSAIEKGVVVRVSSYQLTFLAENGLLQLVRCDCEAWEGE